MGFITLLQLYQHETIQMLLDNCVREENNDNQTTREMEGGLKVYGCLQMVEDAILHNQPITAICNHNNILHIPYCPLGRANTTQSSVDLMEI